MARKKLYINNKEKSKDDFKRSIAIVVEDLKDTFINLGEYDYDTNAVSELIESAGCTEIFEERFLQLTMPSQETTL